MPNATRSLSTDRFDLKSLPEGYVVLRRMSFGEIVQRREMLKLSVTQAKGSSDFQGEMAMASKAITMFEFNACVVEHNLTDANDRPLNLNDPVDFNSLDPKVGQEIENKISDMNNLSEEEEGNSSAA